MTSKISIIVPVYNVEALLPRCLDSIIHQSYKNIEVILINDGSKDKSGRICDTYAKNDDRVKVIHQENRGLSGARNTGLKHFTGDYVGFVDSDDWIESDMYGTMLDALLKHKTDLAECAISEVKDSSTQIDRSGNLIVEDRSQALKRIIANQNFSVCSKLFPKHIINDISFIEGKNSEDVYFTYQILQRVKTSVLLTNKFYNYYVIGDSITRGKYKLKQLDSLDAALFLVDHVTSIDNEKELNKIANDFVIHILTYNYKMLHYNSELDKDLSLRKKIKTLIKKYFRSSHNSSFQYATARYLPIITYNWLISLNKIRRPNFSH